ncbi:hypothetical protein [Streptomyces tagetis]|uniref:Uncharacterized protein n=1 Tax=Streptomyces tagetis TaxID=2820809 RepID=A0A941AXN1_9ACTN|nr:hypothetical protein [Streptomyces sp. RG38]MBQ0826374.1 hypothetical protein [Streptomyces sp. RG38]
MARLQHTVTLTPLPRPWFVSLVAAFHDVAESLEADGERMRLPDGRPADLLLTEGRHLRPGARYRTPGEDGVRPADGDPVVTLTAWDRRRETAVEAVVVEEDGGRRTVFAGEAGLRAADRPRDAWLSGSLRSSGKGARYLGGGAEARVDLDRWWSAAAGRGPLLGGPPLRGTLTHALAHATVTVVPRPADDGDWSVTVRVRLRGRSFARPLLPLVLLFLGRRLRTDFAARLDDAAREWNARLPALLRQDAGRLRADIADGLVTEPAESTEPAEPTEPAGPAEYSPAEGVDRRARGARDT